MVQAAGHGLLIVSFIAVLTSFSHSMSYITHFIFGMAYLDQFVRSGNGDCKGCVGNGDCKGDLSHTAIFKSTDS